MRQITIGVYNYSELDEKAKEKARDIFLELVGYQDANDRILMVFESYLFDLGLPRDVRYSLSYSQGDGVAFYGNIDNIVKVMKRSKQWKEEEIEKMGKLLEKYDISFSIRKSAYFHLYDHYNTMVVDYEVYDGNSEEDLSKEDEEFILRVYHWLRSYVKSVSIELERIGYEIYEEVKEEEYIKDFLETNNWLFREDGRLELILGDEEQHEQA